jgi:hydrogenase maturation protease
MEKVIVLGIGNQLMMDDGIGIYLVEELRKRKIDSPIHFAVGESDIDYCLDQIQEATMVIIIDAIVSGNTPGDVTTFLLSDLHTHDSLPISPHNLHLFNVLYQQKQSVRSFLIGVEPQEIGFYLGLSECLKEKMPTILSKVEAKIEELISQ